MRRYAVGDEAWRSVKVIGPKFFHPFLKGGLVYSLTARVQRGPSEAARCASKGSNRAAHAPSVLFSCALLRLGSGTEQEDNHAISHMKWDTA